MTRGIASLLFAILLAGALPPPAMAQPAARPLSFASVAQATLQDNLQLRAAAFDVAVAQSQLAQAQGAKLPQANLSGSYTRNQEQPLLADPNVYAASLIVSYPLSTGGNLEARIRLAEANVGGAQATYERTKQKFGFGAGYALSNANGVSTTIFGGWLVTLGVTLSVFDGGITQAQIREAQLQLEQLKVREAQIRQHVELDVRVATLALQRAAGELTAATKAVEQGRESVRLATVRYQSGVGTSLELLTAQSNLALAEQSLASARFNQNAARIQLILAMGSQ